MILGHKVAENTIKEVINYLWYKYALSDDDIEYVRESLEGLFRIGYNTGYGIILSNEGRL